MTASRHWQAPDPSYNFEIVATIPTNGPSTYVVDMVSQTWLTADDVDRPEWRHWLTIAVPEQVTSDVGMLYIGGGRNGDAGCSGRIRSAFLPHRAR